MKKKNIKTQIHNLFLFSFAASNINIRCVSFYEGLHAMRVCWGLGSLKWITVLYSFDAPPNVKHHSLCISTLGFKAESDLGLVLRERGGGGRTLIMITGEYARHPNNINMDFSMLFHAHTHTLVNTQHAISVPFLMCCLGLRSTNILKMPSSILTAVTDGTVLKVEHYTNLLNHQWHKQLGFFQKLT